MRDSKRKVRVSSPRKKESRELKRIAVSHGFEVATNSTRGSRQRRIATQRQERRGMEAAERQRADDDNDEPIATTTPKKKKKKKNAYKGAAGPFSRKPKWSASKTARRYARIRREQLAIPQLGSDYDENEGGDDGEHDVVDVQASIVADDEEDSDREVGVRV